VALPTHWYNPWLSPVGSTCLPFWACTKCSIPTAAIGYKQLWFADEWHSPLSYLFWFHKAFGIDAHFWPPVMLNYVSLCSFTTMVPSHFFCSFHFFPFLLPAPQYLCWRFIANLYLVGFPVRNKVFHSSLPQLLHFLWRFCLRPLWIPQISAKLFSSPCIAVAVLTPGMVCMLCSFIVFLALFQPEIHTNLCQFFPAAHPPILAWAVLCIAVIARDHSDLHSATVKNCAHHNWYSASMLTSIYQVLQAGCWRANFADGLMGYHLSLWGMWHYKPSCAISCILSSVHGTHDSQGPSGFELCSEARIHSAMCSSPGFHHPAVRFLPTLFSVGVNSND